MLKRSEYWRILVLNWYLFGGVFRIQFLTLAFPVTVYWWRTMLRGNDGVDMTSSRQRQGLARTELTIGNHKWIWPGGKNARTYLPDSSWLLHKSNPSFCHGCFTRWRVMDMWFKSTVKLWPNAQTEVMCNLVKINHQYQQNIGSTITWSNLNTNFNQ